MGDTGYCGCDGIIHRSGDLVSHGHGSDHGYEWLSQCDGNRDGLSGSCERNTLTYEPVVRIGR